jgi:hypothetical protein
MIIDNAEAKFDAALALAAQEDAPAPTTVYNVNAAPGHAFQFDNGQQAAAHIASAAADTTTGQMLPDTISPRAQPHPLVDANNQQDGPIPAGNGTHAFVFADPQQAAAHFAGAASNTAPMYVFGAQGGDPMVVVPAPGAPTHPDAAAMQGVMPVLAGAIPAGLAAAQAFLLGGPAGPAAGFIFPDIMIHAMTAPTDQHLSPHRKLPAAPFPEPAGPADVGKAAVIRQL